MRVFVLKVRTKTDFIDEDEFAGRLEDLKPWIYNPQTEDVEERAFVSVDVIRTEVLHSL